MSMSTPAAEDPVLTRTEGAVRWITLNRPRRRNALSRGLLERLLTEVERAAVNGACAGAGLAPACAADVRLAAGSAVFATAFLTAGVSGDFGGTWSPAAFRERGAARAAER